MDWLTSFEYLCPSRNAKFCLESLVFISSNLSIFFRLFMHATSYCFCKCHPISNSIGSVLGANKNNNGGNILLYHKFLLSNQSPIYLKNKD